ncbi:MAG TPA: 50S ribosomal protein L24 [bacterium]|nr:50S ribosomal protein L24 [bacterium]HOL49385.1 50S ribosomal protein L24 [bacterium]HPO51406.1 50S ribosomal protein L24 [bacterium]HXK44955.1 50S ribosomal protein L24 [bacterium]
MGFLIRKNDFVVVIKGKDTGKKGRVVRVFPETSRVLVEGVNFVKKATRPRKLDRQGGIITMEKPISIANVQFFCMKCSKKTRLGIKMMDDGSKVRYCKKCGELVEAK